MAVNGVSGSTQSQTQNATTPTSTNDYMGSFLTLLMSELQSQDPTSPLDPNEMVGQIVSINQLSELMQIRQILQGVSTPAS